MGQGERERGRERKRRTRRGGGEGGTIERMIERELKPGGGEKERER